MFPKEFLEDYSLFRKLKLDSDLSERVDYWYKVPINMHCSLCESNQTFNMTNAFQDDGFEEWVLEAPDRVFHLKYICQSCKTFDRRFFIYVNKEMDTCYKVGQYPEWEIKMDKNLEEIIGKHSKTFRKGLVCEAQGYGIGAFSYYRRITEEIIDELLDSIVDLIDEKDKEEYMSALQQTKQTRVTQDKINIVKDLLPLILKPNGVNPLGVLHSELSEGLHAETDEDCLEVANHIKSILTFLINQIIRTKEQNREFSESMKSLLNKKSK